MSIGLVGRKVGMTRVFTEDGASIGVTVVEIVPNRITQVKTPETDDDFEFIQQIQAQQQESSQPDATQQLITQEANGAAAEANNLNARANESTVNAQLKIAQIDKTKSETEENVADAAKTRQEAVGLVIENDQNSQVVAVQ